MKTHPYLDSPQKANTLSAILAVCAAALAIAALFFSSALLGVIAAVAGLLLTCFTLHRVRYNNLRETTHQPVVLLHAFAIYCIIFIGWFFVGSVGTFSYAVLHALLDGALAALLMLAAGCMMQKRMPGWLVGLVAVAAAALSLLDIALPLNLLLALLALFAVAMMLVNKNVKFAYRLGLLLATLCVLVLCVFSAFTNSGMLLHGYLHLAVLALMPFAAWGLSPAYAALPAAAAAVAVVAATAQPTAERETTAKPAATQERVPVPEDDYTVYNSRWVNKKYRECSYEEILDAPVDALYGVSETDAVLLKQAFGIKTVRDFATNKFFRWAEEIVAEAEQEKNA